MLDQVCFFIFRWTDARSPVRRSNGATRSRTGAKPRYMHLKRYLRMMEEDKKAVSQFLEEIAMLFARDYLAAQRAEPKIPKANQAA